MDDSRRNAGELATKGAVATASGGSVLYAGARLLSPGIDFDASMSQVQAITRLDEQADALNALRAQARQLGGGTQFTAGQPADAQGYLGMAGFEPHAIQTAMPGMLDLAAAGGTELAQTADIASNILSGLGLTADEMDRLGDVLVGTFTRSNTTLQMLGDTMKYAAPMAKTYGVELEVAAAMAGKLGDAGLQGSMGGTALSSIMNRLAAPPKGAEKALEQLNIATADAAGNLRPLVDCLCLICPLDENQRVTTHQALTGMALERQAAISADHPLVAEFWDVYEYLESLGEGPQVNHSIDPKLIAINLNDFAEKASDHRQNLADLKTLRTLLVNSRSRKLLEVNKATYSAVRAAQAANNTMAKKSTTVRCWTFQNA